jgi:hypothetical protein
LYCLEEQFNASWKAERDPETTSPAGGLTR